MTNPRHIGIFYSYGPHFLRTVRTFRQNHPDARITAFLPHGFPTELLEPDNICCVSLPLAPGRSRTPQAVVSILRQLRSADLDILVVLFDSPKLQLLCAASKARARYCSHLDGRITPVRLTIIGSLLQTIARNINGTMKYAYIWLYVHCTKVQGNNVPLTTPEPTDRPQQNHQ